jgi:hypothetical protein
VERRVGGEVGWWRGGLVERWVGGEVGWGRGGLVARPTHPHTCEMILNMCHPNTHFPNIKTCVGKIVRNLFPFGQLTSALKSITPPRRNIPRSAGGWPTRYGAPMEAMAEQRRQYRKQVKAKGSEGHTSSIFNARLITISATQLV